MRNDIENFISRDDFNLKGICYLDHAGTTLPSKQLLKDVFEELSTQNMGNPHSFGEFSNFSNMVISAARDMVLSSINAESSQYSVLFTSGATESCELVAESFPWSKKSVYCYPMCAHTSVLGIRHFADNVLSLPTTSFRHSGLNVAHKQNCVHQLNDIGHYNLVTVAGESNFCGYKADLNYMSELFARRSMSTWMNLQEDRNVVAGDITDETLAGEWLWLLDAAKLMATSPFDISSLPEKGRPHFIALSFYKIFGYPSGLGALLVRRDVSHLLQKRYFQQTLA